MQATIEAARILAARGELEAAESRLRALVEDTSSDPLYVLNAAGGGNQRGIVYFPNGMARTRAGGQVGIGQGAFEYYIWYDSRKWNTFRITIFAGAGTVITEMWDPAGSGSWSDNFAHWEYY